LLRYSSATKEKKTQEEGDGNYRRLLCCPTTAQQNTKKAMALLPSPSLQRCKEKHIAIKKTKKKRHSAAQQKNKKKKVTAAMLLSPLWSWSATPQQEEETRKETRSKKVRCLPESRSCSHVGLAPASTALLLEAPLEAPAPSLFPLNVSGALAME